MSGANDKAGKALRDAEAGTPDALNEVAEAEKTAPVETEAVEQEEADGPPGRGLAR